MGSRSDGLIRWIPVSPYFSSAAVHVVEVLERRYCLSAVAPLPVPPVQVEPFIPTPPQNNDAGGTSSSDGTAGDSNASDPTNTDPSPTDGDTGDAGSDPGGLLDGSDGSDSGAGDGTADGSTDGSADGSTDGTSIDPTTGITETIDPILLTDGYPVMVNGQPVVYATGVAWWRNASNASAQMTVSGGAVLASNANASLPQLGQGALTLDAQLPTVPPLVNPASGQADGPGHDLIGTGVFRDSNSVFASDSLLAKLHDRLPDDIQGNAADILAG